MRQQRRNNARGRVQTPNVRPIPDIEWAVNSVQGDLLICDIFTDVTRLAITGIPNIQCSTAPGSATNPHFSGGSFLMTLPSVPTYPCEFSLNSADPAIRDSLGAFLAAQKQTLTSPTAQPLPLVFLNWSVTSYAGTQLVLAVPGLVATSFLDNLLFTQESGGGSFADTCNINGEAVTFTFAAANLQPGQQITVHDAGLLTTGNVRNSLLPQVVTLT